MPVPHNERYFEDYRAGDSIEFGDYLITAEEIVEFGSRYDPQSFHVDARAAARGPFGGLIASGFLTLGAMMRMLTEHFISPVASMGSPGLDEVRWLVPVRPDDRLRVRATILESRRSQSKPDRGVIHVLYEVVNQDNQLAMTVKGWGMYRCRASAA
ncbi:MAG TPA: MaoC family dehydratase [Burkholderiaceae bacterium]